MERVLPPGTYIERIEIDGLFGESEVRIAVNPIADKRLLILYGPNGSGKTTILEIVRSLLSQDEGAGHRTRLAQIPFSKATLWLSGGVVVEAKKREGLVGAYDWSIKKPGSDAIYLNIKLVSGRVLMERWDAVHRTRYAEILAELASVVGGVTFLDDKRTFYVSAGGQSRLVERRIDGRVVQVLTQPGESEDENDPVRIGLGEVVASVRREALLLSNRGTQSTQSIYTTLITKLLSSTHFGPSPIESLDDLAAQLEETESRSERLAAYGLVAPVHHKAMLEAIRKVDAGRMNVIASVVTPYIESLSARLNAVQSLHDSIDGWIKGINAFFGPKVVRFKVGEDVQILSKVGRPLSAKDLSSGERHLLLLMTKAFQLRNTGGLMLVDEPELSLNSTWQRGLIGSMLDSFGGGGCQLVVASHSLEIAAKYEANLVMI